MSSAISYGRKMWRPDSAVGDEVFSVVLPLQYDSWLWRGWVGNVRPGPFPGPGQHPDAGKPFDTLDEKTLRIVNGTCEANLMLFERLSPAELDQMREIGQAMLGDETNLGESMPASLMEKVARIHHIFWILNRELAGAQVHWDPAQHKDHWGHQLWERNLDQRAKDADFIQARAHCRTLGAIDDVTFQQIRTWAQQNMA